MVAVIILVLVVLLVAIDLSQLPQRLSKFHWSLLHSSDHFEHQCHMLWSTNRSFSATKNLSATRNLSATEGILSPESLSTTLGVCLSHGIAIT